MDQNDEIGEQAKLNQGEIDQVLKVITGKIIQNQTQEAHNENTETIGIYRNKVAQFIISVSIIN